MRAGAPAPVRAPTGAAAGVGGHGVRGRRRGQGGCRGRRAGAARGGAPRLGGATVTVCVTVTGAGSGGAGRAGSAEAVVPAKPTTAAMPAATPPATTRQLRAFVQHRARSFRSRTRYPLGLRRTATPGQADCIHAAGPLQGASELECDLEPSPDPSAMQPRPTRHRRAATAITDRLAECAPGIARLSRSVQDCQRPYTLCAVTEYRADRPTEPRTAGRRIDAPQFRYTAELAGRIEQTWQEQLGSAGHLQRAQPGRLARAHRRHRRFRPTRCSSRTCSRTRPVRVCTSAIRWATSPPTSTRATSG